jgi:hypothetical protein
VADSRRTLVIALAFVLAVGGAFLFASRASQRAHHFRTASEPIHGWMSIPFIAHSHHVPPSVLFQAIGVEPLQPRDHRSVRHLAHQLHRPVPEILAKLQTAIDGAAQSPAKPPAPVPNGPPR